jgi:hypothetical protein
MRDHARLRATLRAALLVAPLLGGGCGGKSAPAGDKLIQNSPPDGGVKQAVGEGDPLPADIRNCTNGVWCGPPEVVERIKAPDDGTPAMAGSCQSYFRTNNLYFSHNQDATDQRTAAGEYTCCYTWESSCPRPVGRPHRDGAHAVVAGVRGLPRELPPEAAAWLEDALGEHASIAAFARAAQELLAVGAPAELVAGCQRAALDEVRHARACLGIASRLAGVRLAFGPLAPLAPRAPSLARLAADTFVEGCVEETLGAVIAERRLAAERDPRVRGVLRMRARDEARHAALAWRTVAWAAARDPGVLAALPAPAGDDPAIDGLVRPLLLELGGTVARPHPSA